MTSFQRQNDETPKYLKMVSFFVPNCTWSLLIRFYACAKFDLVCVKGKEVTEGARNSPPPPRLREFLKSHYPFIDRAKKPKTVFIYDT